MTAENPSEKPANTAVGAILNVTNRHVGVTGESAGHVIEAIRIEPIPNRSTHKSSDQAYTQLSSGIWHKKSKTD